MERKGKLIREILKLKETKEEGLEIDLNENDLSELQAIIDGPVNTPYEGGRFHMKLVFSNDYPISPPKGYFITKIFHPNVSLSGEICVNALKKDWNSELGISHILLVIKCLLIYPNPESALNEEAGKLLLEKYDEYAKRAKLMTSIHAISSNEKSKNTNVVLTDENKNNINKRKGLRRL